MTLLALAAGAIVLGFGVAVGFALGIGASLLVASRLVRWAERRGLL